jgi:nucleoside-diphosphate-sugar epimerase
VSLLIFGCGYLGMRVAKLAIERGEKVYGITRNRADELRSHGITPIIGDVTAPIDYGILGEESVDVVYSIGLDRKAGKSMKEVYVDGLRNVLTSSLNIHRFMYVSSTSVYGQTDGSWVDESSPTVPVEESGKIVLEAEQVLRQLAPFAIILRFAGIYGPDRLLRRDSLLRGEPVPGNAAKFINLIHVDDGANAVLAALAAAEDGSTHNISDGHPPTRGELFNETARLVDAPAPVFLEDGSSKEANRRIRPGRFSTQLRYETYCEGLAHALSDTRAG